MPVHTRCGGDLCGVSTINAPIIEDKTKLTTPTEPLRSAYIVADIAMQDPVAISLQGELYALERRTLAEYNGDNTLFTSRADVLRLDEGRYSFSSRGSVSRHIECLEKTSLILHSKI